jgi:hypothetical protein
MIVLEEQGCPTRASATRSPETAQCDKGRPVCGGWVGKVSQLDMKNLIQLCVQVGAVSVTNQFLPPGDGERVLPSYGHAKWTRRIIVMPRLDVESGV